MSETSLVENAGDASLLEAGMRDGVERTQAIQQEKIALLESTLGEFANGSESLSEREREKIQLLSEAIQRDIDLRRRALAVHKARHGGFGRDGDESSRDASPLLSKRMKPSYEDASESTQRRELGLLREVYDSLSLQLASLRGEEREKLSLAVEAVEREVKDREVFLQKTTTDTY